uniref:Protein kinase domain-containing protein n=1 Tax=Physcomitrium patens TaxID=3218 RepID=A0A7I4C9B2_PHYPA
MGGGVASEGQMEKRKYPYGASDYKLFEEVGQGVTATVYRAHCIPYNETVAIKSLDLEKCNTNLDDIRREAQTMSLIDHPNVVKAYCSFVVEQSLWVVMPFMAGGSFLHIMKSAFPDGFDEPVIATVLKETLKALEYLHRHGHIHRDVKAGNILVDAAGAVKLGDFGVSACLFDTGDRQRTRNTFVGTPCWMAPEVMEQLHGYDFKADIWSFGITALELAHGHAPFSKYPPIKVLLMTLQNAPPGLDHERDKKFSKSFKEMIAMCLVKDPAKRPSADKLLRHSFFKQARSGDYIARNVLYGLPPLGERVKKLKVNDANRLAQNEQEVQSQNEYKRGVSGWNFDLDDLKAEAALIQDGDEDLSMVVGKDVIVVEEQEVTKLQVLPFMETDGDVPSHCLTPSPPPSLSRQPSIDRFQQPVTIHSIIAETTSDAGERVTRVRSGPLPNPVQTKPTNGMRGRFEVWEDNNPESPVSHGSPRESRRSAEDKEPSRRERDSREFRKADDRERKEDREQRRSDERGDRDAFRRVGSFGSERVLSSIRGLTMDSREQDRDRDIRQNGRNGEELIRYGPRERSYSGPLPSPVDRSIADYRLINGGSKETLEEKTKYLGQKGSVLQKGRFSVTSDDMNLEDSPHVSSRKYSNVPGLQNPASPSQQSIASSQNISGAISLCAGIMPQLHQILQHGQRQQEGILNLIQSLSPTDAANLQALNSASRYLRSLSANSVDSSSGCGSPRSPQCGSRNRPSQVEASHKGYYNCQLEVSTDKERELLHQVSELQARMANLVDELQTVKLRNVSLERQLNAIYNKEEEERIRKEDAARESG